MNIDLIAVIFVSAVLGGIMRRAKGEVFAGSAMWAAWGFGPLCLLTIIPLWGALGPGKFVAASIAFSGLSALFLLVEANNGGDGHPLRRFGPFGLGYLIPAAWVPRVRMFGVTWIDAGEPTDVGELWLGATWFGFWSAAACAAASMEG